MSNTDLGVKYPCYGEYKCYRCNKTWASLKSWRDFGQKCKSCNDSVKPEKESLLQLYYYVCKTCEKVWKNKLIDVGQLCKNCNSLVKPIAHNVYMKSRIGQPTLFKNSESYDLKGGHREDLCEKCQMYGAPCSATYASATNRKSSVAPSSGSSFASISNKNASRQAVPNGSDHKPNDGPARSAAYATITKGNSLYVTSSLTSPRDRGSSRQVVRNNKSEPAVVTPNYGWKAEENNGSACYASSSKRNSSDSAVSASTSERRLPRPVVQNNSSEPIYAARPKTNTSCIIL